MITLDRGNIHKIERALKEFPKRVPIVMSKVLNKTASQGKTLIARTVAAGTDYKITTIKKMLIISRSNKKTLRALIQPRGRKPPLIEVAKRVKQDETGVSYKLFGESKHAKHAFIATMPAGNHKGIYQRYHTSRLPIKELMGPTIKSTIIKDYRGKYKRPIGRLLGENTKKEIKRELQHQANKAKK